MPRFFVRQCSTAEATDYSKLITKETSKGRWRLNLDARDYERFPDSILTFGQIEELLLCESSIRSIPERITNLSNLKVLKLRRNRLETFPSSLCGLGQLEELDLSYNVFGEVCSTISKLTNLKDLNLAATALSGELCEEIGQLEALEKLNVSRNELSALPMSMQSLAKLWKLDVSRNEFKVEPAVLSELESLKILDISYNRLEKFDVDLSKAEHLRNLDLEKNCLVTFPDVLGSFKDLQRLDLAKNGMKVIPESITSLKNLKELWLEDNCLDAFPDVVCQLETLEILCINGNEVKTIPRAIAKLKNLKGLDVGRCGLSEFPVALYSLRQLEWLVLSDNHLTTLPSQLPELSKLSVLDVQGNQLRRPVTYLCQRGVSTIFNYLKEIGEKKTVHQKVIFLGSEDAGKTTLCKVLLTDKPQQCRGPGNGCKTIVLDQFPWKPHPEMTLQMFDFGGDESYQMVQHLFLDIHSIMLLVVDMRTYEKQYYHQRVGSWIQLLQARAPGASLYLVGTHTDQCSASDVDRKEADILSEMNRQEEIERRNLKDALSDSNVTEAASERLRTALERRLKLPTRMHLVSCTSPKLTNIAPLKATIADDARRHGREIPASWQTLYEGIRRNGKDFLTLQEVHAIDKPRTPVRSHSTSTDPEHGKYPLTRKWSDVRVCPSSDRLGDILSFFHSIGELVWFENSDKISKYVFHKHEFLIRVLKAIFPGHIEENLEALRERLTKATWEMAKEDLAQRGVMIVKVLKELWFQQDLKPEVMDSLIELLHQLDLCYQLPADASRPRASELCFPRLLRGRATMGDASFDGTPADGNDRFILEFVRCNEFPPAIYEKIAVRMHRHVKDVNSIVLTKGDFSARIGSTRLLLQHHVPDGKCIRLVVEGQDASDSWVRLIEFREEIEKILENWPGVCYETWLLCPHCVKAGKVAAAYRFQGTCLQLEPPDGEECYTCRREGNVPVSFAFFRRVIRDIPSQEKLIDIACKVGDKWRFLGRALNLEESHLKDIDTEHSLSEKCFQVLLKWKQTRVSKATCAELADALCVKSVDRADLAELLQG